MLVDNKHYSTIWLDDNDPELLWTIDQNKLPFAFRIVKLRSVNDILKAIRDMTLRGAPLIGAAGAYGVYFSCIEAKKKFIDPDNIRKYINSRAYELRNARPTAVNLKWAVDNVLTAAERKKNIDDMIKAALRAAEKIRSDDIKSCRKIGLNGYKIIREISRKKKTVNILTHCNAGWLATIDMGTATSPIYTSFQNGIDVHVWIEETRPRNQGSRLTAWEMAQMKIPHTIVTDNAGGYLLEKGMIDIVITGADRVTAKGDVCNKIGTYKTALAAKDNRIPFYSALPSSSFDLRISDGLKEIPIEERSGEEVKFAEGLLNNKIEKVLIAPWESNAKNYGFDITPSRLVTGLITDKGIVKADKKDIAEKIATGT